MSSKQFDNIVAAIRPKMTGVPQRNYKAVIQLGSVQVEAMRVVSITRRQLYIDNLFEEGLITLAMSPQQYSRIVMEGHENMYITIIERDWRGRGNSAVRYRLVMETHTDPQIEGNIQHIEKRQRQDDISISIVTFQFIDMAAYNLRLINVGGTYRNARAIDALVYQLQKNKLVDELAQSEAVAKIMVDENYLTKKFTEIEIADGTNLMALPDYLQNRYGIYNQGFGCYLKNQTWYVFAPFSLIKKDKDVFKLVILNMPASQMRSADRSVAVVGKTITILATGETKHQRSTDSDALNKGTAVFYGDTDALDAGMVDLSKSPKLKPKDYVSLYRSSNYKNKLDNITTAKGRFVDNDAPVASDMAKRGGDIVTVQWENGVLDVFEPGMPVTFITSVGNGVKQMEGTLITAVMASTPSTQGIVETVQSTVVHLTLFLKSTEAVSYDK